MKKKAFFVLTTFFVVSILLVGCGGKASHWKTYNFANEEFTELTEQYNAYFPLQPAAEQDRWQEKFDPVFLKGDVTLTRWRRVLDAGDDPKNQEFAWMAIKSEVIKILFELSTPPDN